LDCLIFYNCIIFNEGGDKMINNDILQKLLPITKEEQKILDGKDNIDRDIYMSKNSNVINSKKLLHQGKLISIRPHTRFIDFPSHSHDYIEVVYMCSGSSVHIVNGDRVTLKQGELLFLSCDAVHEIKKTDLNDIAINFIILPQFFDKALTMLGEQESPIKSFIIDALGGKTSSIKYLHFKVSDVLPIQNLVENLIYTLIHETRNKRQLNQITLGLLFLQLTAFSERLSISDKTEALLIEVYNYIEENYKEGSLQVLANQLHCDFYWLSREIKRKTGKTYTDLLQEKRISQAEFLLNTTSINVSDISVAVGYENVSYFHRIFTKATGMSPNKYRNCK